MNILSRYLLTGFSPLLLTEVTNFLSMFIRSVRKSRDYPRTKQETRVPLQSRIVVDLMYHGSGNIFPSLYPFRCYLFPLFFFFFNLVITSE